MEKIWTVLEIINWANDFFAQKGVDSPRLTIELLLCDVLQCKRIDLYTSFDKPLNEQELAKTREYVIRRAKREPLQYILGKAHFYDFELNVDCNVLIPRPETEELAELILKSYDSDAILNILDIGTGSGCLSILLADKFKNSMVTACDINHKAIEVAKSNAKKYNINNIEFLCLDIINNIPQGKFDVIVSNPPYIKKEDYQVLEPELKYEPGNALTDERDGLTFYRKFSEIFPKMLNDEGKFFLEYALGQSEEIKKLFEEKYFVTILPDFSSIYRYLIGENRKSITHKAQK